MFDSNLVIMNFFCASILNFKKIIIKFEKKMELSTRSSHYLTSNQRAAIYGAYVFGLQRNASYQDIANLFPELRIDRHTVKRIADNYEKKGNFENAPKIGRPSTFQVEVTKNFQTLHCLITPISKG